MRIISTPWPRHARTVSLGTGAAGELAAVHFVQNVKCRHFLYQREKQWEMLISGQRFAPGRDMDTGKWHPVSCDWRVVHGLGTCPNACCQVRYAWYRFFQCQDFFCFFFFSPPSFSPPSAPCVSCTLGIMLQTNIFPCHRALNKHPKTFVCSVTALIASAEIWHGVVFCPIVLKQNKHKCLSICRSKGEGIGALNLLLWFTVLFFFFLMALLLFFWRQ